MDTVDEQNNSVLPANPDNPIAAPSAGDNPDRFTKQRPQRPAASAGGLGVSHVLIGINAAVFVLMLASGVSITSPTIESLVRWQANFGPLTMNGEPWRLFTSMFIHIGIIHIAMNMYALSGAGPSAEFLFGKKNFTALYLLSGLGGSILSNCWNPRIVAAGASGAIFGVIGGLIGFFWRNKGYFAPGVFKRQMNSLLAFVAVNIYFGLSVAGIDNAAHMGGLVSGVALGWILAPSRERQDRWGARQWAGIGAICVVLGAGFWIGSARTHASNSSSALLLIAPRISFGTNEEILYSNGASQEDAQKLGATLKKLVFFDGKGAKTIGLSKPNGHVEVAFAVKEGAWDKDTTVSALNEIGVSIANDVFEGQPITIVMMDRNLTEHRRTEADPKAPK